MHENVRAALFSATNALTPHTCTARLDVELLMAHALGISREAMILNGLDGYTPEGFYPLLSRRLAGEPIAYITGIRDFWSISLMVTQAVLIPRPDSETLIEAALDYFGRVGPGRILDLGTGSGALLLAALTIWPDAVGQGVDISEAALGVARANAERLSLAQRVQFSQGNWGLDITEKFDLILCNPPYVENGALLAREISEYEPAQALFSGEDGLDDYQKLMPQFAHLMNRDGIVALEIGSGQAGVVGMLAKDAGLAVEVRKDLAGKDRCLLLK